MDLGWINWHELIGVIAGAVVGYLAKHYTTPPAAR